MTDHPLQPSDELIERALAHRAPRGPDADLLGQIASAASLSPQVRPWGLLGLPGLGEPTRRLIWIAVVLMLTAALGLGVIVAGGLPRSRAVIVLPSPSGSSPTTTVPSAVPGSAVAIEDVADNAYRGDVTYTSRRFEPRVTFRLRGSPLSGTYLIPSSRTSARTMIIENRGRRGEEIRLTRPFAVDCGTLDEHPDAASLAAAILAKPGLANVRDLGSQPYVSESAMGTDLIHGTYPSRVIKIDGTGRTFDADVSDPDGCRLLAEPGSGDPTIEIRGDMAALLILTDVGGELLVIRVSDRGYDASTGAAFMTRDYLVDLTALTASPLPVYLGDLLDLVTVSDLRPQLPPTKELQAPEASMSAGPTTEPKALPPSPWPVVAIEDGAFQAEPGTTYTSSRFEPRITFEVNGEAPNSRPSHEWCSTPYTSTRMIAFRHAKACVHELDIVRPFAVECGPADVHPDAATLAQAVLVQLGTAAFEVDALSQSGVMPPDLFEETAARHIIQIRPDGQRRGFQADAIDPDGCRLLPEPGSDDPTIEIRGDIASTLILSDVDGELVIVRASSGGHDAPSGAAAIERGYAGQPVLHLLQINHHIRFD